MRALVCNNQKRLSKLLAEAKEWNEARASAAEEELGDWALLYTAAEGSCPRGDACPYHVASEEILSNNSSSFDR